MKVKPLLSLGCLALAFNATAGTQNIRPVHAPIPPATISASTLKEGYFIQADAGISMAKIGDSQRIEDGTPGDLTTYKDKSSLSTIGVFGLQAGYQFPINSTTWLDLGIGLYQTLDYKSKGEVYILSNPTYHMFDYKYKISQFRAMFEPRLLFAFSNKITPYISLGVGYARTKAHDFEFTKLIPYTDKKPFGDHSTDTIAAQGGVGILYPINQNVSVSANYRLIYTPEAKFDKAVDQVKNDRLKTGSLWLNDITLGIRYTF